MLKTAPAATPGLEADLRLVEELRGMNSRLNIVTIYIVYEDCAHDVRDIAGK
jgi:hypothetical protein